MFIVMSIFIISIPRFTNGKVSNFNIRVFI